MQQFDSYYDFCRKKGLGVKKVRGTEGTVFFIGDEVYKIFNDNFPPVLRDLKRFSKIANLDDTKLTTFKDFIHFLDNGSLAGVVMPYAGVPLDEYIHAKVKSKDDMIEKLLQVKNIVLYLKKKKLVHGDLHIQNILVDDVGVCRLTDVNGLIFSRKQQKRLSNLYYLWLLTVKKYKLLDELAFNLLTFILLNYEIDEVKCLIEDATLEDNDYLCYLVKDNHVFDKDVYEVFSGVLEGDESAIKALKPNTFLIDHLK